MTSRTLNERIYVGLSRYDEGTTVSVSPIIDEGTRDERVYVTFPNGEGTYLRPEQVGDDTPDVERARQIIAANIAGRIAAGATYDEATAGAFAYLNDRWPHVVAAVLAEVAA